MLLPKPIINQNLDPTHFCPDSSAKPSNSSPSNLKSPLGIYFLNPAYDPAITSPYQEEFVEPVCRRPTKQELEIPPILADQIDYGNIFHKFLPNKSNVNNLLKQIKRKILR